MVNAKSDHLEDQRDPVRESLASLLDSYRLRIMASLAGSLLLIILAFHVPIYQSIDSVGWQFRKPPELIEIDFLRQPKEPVEETGGGVIITIFGEEADVEEGEEEVLGEEEEEEVEPEPEPELPEVAPLRMQARRVVLDVADTPPRVMGGLGAYYINIEYPEIALQEGIEGQMILSFVVETNGSATEIEVLKSLHPACDSAAVAALRRTTFVPGRQNGEKVPVRMRLPVRFQLIQPPKDGTSANPPNL